MYSVLTAHSPSLYKENFSFSAFTTAGGAKADTSDLNEASSLTVVELKYA